MNPKNQNQLDPSGLPPPENILQPSTPDAVQSTVQQNSPPPESPTSSVNPYVQPTGSWIDSFKNAPNPDAPAQPVMYTPAEPSDSDVYDEPRHLLPKIAALVFLALLVGIAGVLFMNRHALIRIVATQGKGEQTSTKTDTVSNTPTLGGAAVKPGATSGGTTKPAANPTPAVATVPAGTVLFNDDFNGPAGSQPDSTKWYPYSSCTYNGSASYGSIQCGEDETLDGQGHLIIPATPSRGQSLMTGDKFKFTYGTASAWIKFPPQVGYWPAFWTLNNNASGVNAPFLGEIDAMEGYTTWEDGIVAGSGYHAGFHNWSNVAGAQQTGGGPDECAEPGINLSAAYHKYTVNVAPNALSFYFDDKLCGATSYGPQTNPGAPYGFAPSPNITNGNWLILTLAVGGAGGQQTPASQNAQLLVDKVQVVSN